jgi:hypothetical protein
MVMYVQVNNMVEDVILKKWDYDLNLEQVKLEEDFVYDLT